MKKKYFFGFTLAEVLITLGIIGVVAGMTTPTLMQNIQNNEFKTKMRKEYSILSGAYQLLSQENGGQFVYALSSLGCSAYDNVCFRNVFKQKISSIRECDRNDGSNLNVCSSSYLNVKYLNGNNSNSWYHDDSIASFVSKDGSSFSFYLWSLCTTTLGNAGFTNTCGCITVDVNGMKGPNTWGRDMYLFFVYSDRIRPSSIDTLQSFAATADDCGTGTNYGYTCASKYLLGN